jgi:hypothetical protein
MIVIVKKTGGGKRLDKMVQHLKYIGFRAREKEEDDKGFFNEKYDKGVDYRSFVKSIKDNKALKHPNSNKYHKFVFSLNSEDYKNSNRNFKDIMRSTMARYEKRTNTKLNWIGSFHEVDGHPHCHIVISGASQNKDINGKYTRIYFKKDDFRELRSDFKLEVDRDMVRTYEKDYQPGKFKPAVNMASQMFDRVLHELQRDVDREREREK